jgi:hypothetical protein
MVSSNYLSSFNYYDQFAFGSVFLHVAVCVYNFVTGGWENIEKGEVFQITLRRRCCASKTTDVLIATGY